MTEIITENIDIQIEEDNFILKGSIYSTSETPPKAPWIINFAGLMDHRESYFVKFYSEKFASAGYYILAYDYRAHGETAKVSKKRNWMKVIDKIFTDTHDVISYVFQECSDRLLDDKIALFGRSLGGAIILTHGFQDHRAKKLIPLCTRYDYHTVTIKFPEHVIKKVSPMNFIKKDPSNNDRILLAHCKDDERIPFKNVLQIKEHLGLRNENVLIYETGGHAFRGYRDDIFKKSLNFLKNL